MFILIGGVGPNFSSSSIKNIDFCPPQTKVFDCLYSGINNNTINSNSNNNSNNNSTIYSNSTLTYTIWDEFEASSSNRYDKFILRIKPMVEPESNNGFKFYAKFMIQNFKLIGIEDDDNNDDGQPQKQTVIQNFVYSRQSHNERVFEYSHSKFDKDYQLSSLNQFKYSKYIVSCTITVFDFTLPQLISDDGTFFIMDVAVPLVNNIKYVYETQNKSYTIMESLMIGTIFGWSVQKDQSTIGVLSFFGLVNLYTYILAILFLPHPNAEFLYQSSMLRRDGADFKVTEKEEAEEFNEVFL
eukprot:gene5928-7380_t